MSVAEYTETSNWYEANSRYLLSAIAQVRQALVSRFEQHQNPVETFQGMSGGVEVEAFSPPPTLERLCQIFGLSPFEREVLLLCAGMEWDENWGVLCAEAQSNPHLNYPTLSLARSLSAVSSWVMLSPEAPLRRWRLIEIGEGNALLTSRLRIDERIWHYLLGVQHLDQRLRGIVQPLAVSNQGLQPSHQRLVEQVVAAWLPGEQTLLPVVQLCGSDGVTKRAIASAVCQQLNLNLHLISSDAIPNENSAMNLVKELCEREWLLSQAVVLLECEEREEGIAPFLSRFIETVEVPLMVSTLERQGNKKRSAIAPALSR